MGQSRLRPVRTAVYGRYEMSDATSQLVIDFSPATRKSHPETSQIAEENITSSGKRQRHCQIILTALRQHNGSTSAELAQYTPLLNKEQVHKRMHDLVENEYIKRGDKRICNVKGSLCCTWWIL
jgi:predicted HTH transcriptional regulator